MRLLFFCFNKKKHSQYTCVPLRMPQQRDWKVDIVGASRGNCSNGVLEECEGGEQKDLGVPKLLVSLGHTARRRVVYRGH